jgi:hypothetical protein
MMFSRPQVLEKEFRNQYLAAFLGNSCQSEQIKALCQMLQFMLVTRIQLKSHKNSDWQTESGKVFQWLLLCLLSVEAPEQLQI